MSLLPTLNSGVSALRSFSQGLDAIGNDIANVNTTAFKAQDTDFADTFNGQGVQVVGNPVNFSQGSLSSTGVSTDLGISGNGYFTVLNNTSSAQYLTRDGSFTIDPNGYLVNAQGYRVQGLVGGSMGSIKIPATNTGGAALQSESIDQSGNVVATYADGTQTTVGQVALFNPTDPTTQLSSQGDNLYSYNGGAISLTSANAPGSSGLGTVQAGTLEQSNVDLTQEFSDMITMQRAFEANSRVVTVSDTILQDIVNLKSP
ncbi:MAG TPA: flagellar hook basal-body protein [Opitutaceae bacterium]|nr:flagellar hook basal-body protein [Opitutaceae bacterium]